MAIARCGRSGARSGCARGCCRRSRCWWGTCSDDQRRVEERSMKLAYSAWAMPRLPLPEQVAIVRDCGYSAIELVSAPGAPLDALATDAATRKQVRKQLQEAGL